MSISHNMVSKRNHLIYHIQKQFLFILPVFSHKILLKNELKEMLIKQMLNLIRGVLDPLAVDVLL